jgi:hypothetical protein
MKRNTILLLLFLCTAFRAAATEGMWLPFLLEKMNEKEMRAMGMKIRARDIYDVNAGSLKDAVVIFGGGCTGEVISQQGLVLTNHHCGYGTVQGLSNLENNYLLKGFWAKNRGEELPCPGLSVTFIVRIDDVTEAMQKGIQPSMADTTRSRIFQQNAAAIEKEMKKSSGYETLVKSFFSDNKFYLFLMEKFTDIRLVGFPPNGIGKFGGDTDNWAWPRHTGDFGLFRIYAGKDNKPAAYSKENLPFIPRRSIKINIQGVQEGDFSFVYGFPGRTSEYLTSDGVSEVMNILDPARIKLREKRLSIMDADMAASEKTFIQYAAKQAGIANYYKKWKGELLGLQLNKAVDKKKAEEAEFVQWVNEVSGRKPLYSGVIDSLSAVYKRQAPVIKQYEYLNEAIWASEVMKKGSVLVNLQKACDTLTSMDSVKKYRDDLLQFLTTINLTTDEKITRELHAIYANDIQTNPFSSPEFIRNLYAQSMITHPEQLMKYKTISELKAALPKDPAYMAFVYYDGEQKKLLPGLRASQSRLTALYGQYMQALMAYKEGQAFYPDANSTLRVSYGKVQGLSPQDGMEYRYFTTLDGAVRKHNPNVEEFAMPEKLLALHQAKDYGRYAIEVDGKPTVPLAFLASNHTTGGNSGSPVFNARGELIGTNFDRIWEGTMSDILYDINLCRNITLDIRYTLFIIEKFGGAKWVVDEMELVD